MAVGSCLNHYSDTADGEWTVTQLVSPHSLVAFMGTGFHKKIFSKQFFTLRKPEKQKLNVAVKGSVIVLERNYAALNSSMFEVCLEHLQG